MSTSRRGFTLIELLVVVAIIAILAAILFPVFLNAKRAAHINTCVSNIRQWGVAMTRYVDEYNGSYPWAGVNNLWPHRTTPRPFGQGGKCKSCVEALWPYTSKNHAIKFCPLWKASKQSRNWPTVDWSYWYYCCHVWNQGHASALCGYKVSDVRRPSRKPCLVEINCPHDEFDQAGNPITGQSQFYCDGHAKCVTGKYADIMAIVYRLRTD